MNIYNIKKEFDEILNNPEFVDFETGEITEAGEKALKENQENIQSKCENIAMYMKNLEGNNLGYSTEIERIGKLKKSNDNKIKGLKKLLEFALDGKDLKTDLFKFSFTKSESTSIFDKNLLPQKFITEQVVEKIAGLPEIKKYLKEEIEARIEEAKNENKEYDEQNIKKEVCEENGIEISFNRNLQIK